MLLFSSHPDHPFVPLVWNRETGVLFIKSESEWVEYSLLQSECCKLLMLRQGASIYIPPREHTIAIPITHPSFLRSPNLLLFIFNPHPDSDSAPQVYIYPSTVNLSRHTTATPRSQSGRATHNTQ